MRNFLILSAILLLAIVIACAKPSTEANVAAFNAAPLPSMSPSDNAPRISLEDAKKEFDAGTAVFVDARAQEAYKMEHIKGAINVQSADRLKEALKSIPPDKKLIVYCS